MPPEDLTSSSPASPQDDSSLLTSPVPPPEQAPVFADRIALDQTLEQPSMADRISVDEEENKRQRLENERKRMKEVDLLSKILPDTKSQTKEMAGIQTQANALIDPKLYTDMTVNWRATAALMGKPLDELDATQYGDYKAQIAVKLNKPAPKSESEYRSMLSEYFVKEKDKDTALNELYGNVVLKAFQDTGMGKNRAMVGLPTEYVKQWEEQHKDLIGGDAGYHAQANRVYNQTLKDIESIRGRGAETFSALMDFTQGKADDERIAQVAEHLSSSTPEERQKVYSYIGLAAEAGHIDRAGIEQFAINMGQSFSRGFDFIPQGTLQGQEDAFREMRDTLATGKVWLRKSEGTPTLNDVYRPSQGAVGSAINIDMTGREATPEEVATLKAQAEGGLKTFGVIRELRNAAKSSVDPIRPVFEDSAIERGAYGLAGSLGIMVPVAINPAIGMLAYQAQEYDRIMLENPDIDPTFAKGLSLVEGAGNAALDRLQLGAINGKLPVFGGLLNGIKNNGIRRVLTTVGVEILEQNLQEGAQDLIAPLTETLTAALREDMPDKDFGALMKDYLGSRAETFFAVLPLALLGGGIGTYRDLKNPALQLADKQLAMAGFGPAQRDYINQASSLEEKATRVEQEWSKRTEQDITAGKELIAASIAEARSQKAGDTVEVNTKADGTNEWIVRDPAGKEVARVASEDEAVTIIADRGEAEIKSQANVVADLLDSDWRKDKLPNFEAQFGGEVTPEQLLKDAEAKGDTKLVESIKASIEAHGNDPAELSKLRILGESWVTPYAEGQYKAFVKLNEGSTAQDAFEELAHNIFDIDVAEGRITKEQARAWVSQTTAAGVAGYKFGTDAEVRESMAQIAQDFAHNKIDQTNLPSSFVAFLKKLYSEFVEFIRRAKLLDQAFKDGKIDAEFERYLMGKIGLSDASMIEREVNRIEGEQGDLVQGKLFSIRKASETALAKAEEFKKSADAAEDEFWQNVWPKALKEAGYTLKASLKNLKTAAEKSLPHILEWLKENPQYIDYYHKDWELTKAHLQDAIPGFNDEDLHAFRLFTGITSPNTLLAGNLKDAVQLINLWKKEGSIKSMKWEWSAKGNRKVGEGNPFTLESTTGAGKIFAAHAIEDFYSKLGSWKAVNDFLHEGVTTKELNEVNREAGYKGSVGDIGKIREVVMQATGQDELIPRMFIFGPKVGAYTLNTTGDDRFTTTDIWEARFIRSHFPEMFKDGTGLPVNVDEHEIFQKFANSFNELFQKETGLDLPPSALQAVRWFYMIDSAKRAGYRYAKTDGSISDYTKQAIKSKLGIDLGSDSSRRGQGNGAGSQGSQEQGQGDSVAFSIRARDEAGNRKAISRQWGSFPKGTEVEVIGERSKDPLDTNLLVRFPDGTEEKFPINWLKTPKGQMTAPKESLPQLVNRLGREGVNDLLTEWNDAELSPDGNFIMGVVDPRSSMKLERIPVREFLDWVQENNSNKDSNTSFSIRARDEAYDAAVKSGDMETAQRLVNEARDEFISTHPQAISMTSDEWSKVWNAQKRKDLVLQQFKEGIIKNLIGQAKSEGWNWGWKLDPKANHRFKWVAYFDTPAGQISFHTRIPFDALAQLHPIQERLRAEINELDQEAKRFKSKTGNKEFAANRNKSKFLHEQLDDAETLVSTDHPYQGSWDGSKGTQGDRLGKLNAGSGGGNPSAPTESQPMGGRFVVRDLEQHDTIKSLVKLSDAVTYDDAGNVIPLSQRFNPESNDIRYSIQSQEQIDRVNKAVADTTQFAEGRMALYERAKERFKAVLAENKDILDALKEGGAAPEKIRRQKLIQGIAELEVILRQLPAEVRGKVGGFGVLARGGTGDTFLANFFRDRVRMIDEQLEKYLSNEYDEELSRVFDRAKPKKNLPGEKPKGIGADIQDLFAKVKEAQRWSAEEINAHLASIDSRLESEDLSPADEARLTREADLIGLVGGWKNKTSNEKAHAIKTLKETWAKGYYNFILKKTQEKEQRIADRQEAISATGKEGVLAERQEADKKENGWKGKFQKGYFNLISWDQFVSVLFGEKSEIATRLSNGERKANAQKEDATQAKMDEISDFFAKLAKGDKLKGEQLRWQMSQKTLQPFVGTPWSGLDFSEMEAISATMLWMQEDGKRHMMGKFDDGGKPISAWHYTQEFVDILEANLSKEAKSLRDFLLKKYDTEYDSINKVYKALNGINLPKIENYSPVTVAPINAPAGTGIDPVTGGIAAARGTSPGALRTRGQAIAEPKFNDVLQTYIAHTKQMEHWKAYAPFMAEANGILRNRDVQNAIEAKGGKEAKAVLNTWTDLFSQGGVRSAEAQLGLSKDISALGGRAARVALVGRLGTIIIQSTQLGAALAEMPTGSYILRMSKLLSGNLGWKAAFESDYIQRRLNEMPPIVRQAVEGLQSDRPNVVKSAVDKLGRLISGADALFTAGTYAITYDYHLKQAKDMGIPSPEAYAKSVAERAVDRLAQPTRMGARSVIENTSTGLIRNFWAFASESRKNLGLAAYALASKDPSRIGRTLVSLVLLNSLVGNIIRNAWSDARDDDDDEWFDEKHWGLKRMLVSTIVDSLQVRGIPVLGDAISTGLYDVFNQYHQGGSLVSFSNATRALKHIPKYAEGDADWEMTFKDIDGILSVGGLFNESIAAAASLSHLANDAFGVSKNAKKAVAGD